MSGGDLYRQPTALRGLLRVLGTVAGAVLLVEITLVAVLFPYHTAPPEHISFQPASKDNRFYDATYAENDRDLKYVETARKAAEREHIKDRIAEFVQTYHLQKTRVLDVGAGSGFLQDEVADYTGLDISETARRYFHKPFVQADARAMPFTDGTFDAIWSVWVLEHIPNPEMALTEMRRVLKPNGVLFLAPAWLVSPLAAQGYDVRPYSAFGMRDKIIKASSALRESPLFEASYLLPSRALRRGTYALTHRPTSLHYWPLTPNYEQYWEGDSDAVNSIDMYETFLWFKSRGDLCLNCGSEREMFRTKNMRLVIRVKPAASSR
jgi:SAM-dependent methyltransferase